MKTKKEFDCVAMKDRIQAELLERWNGASDKEIESEIKHDLAASNSSAAKLWRRIRKQAAKPRELSHS